MSLDLVTEGSVMRALPGESQSKAFHVKYLAPQKRLPRKSIREEIS
jgi:hypothetical protein